MTTARPTPETDAISFTFLPPLERAKKLDALARSLERRLAEAEERISHLRTWDGLMSVLDEFYPPDIFTGVSGDAGPRLIVLMRAHDKALAERDQYRADRDALTYKLQWAQVRVRELEAVLYIDKSALPATYDALKTDHDKALAELVNLRDDYLRQHVKFTDTQARVRELEEREQSICDECEHYDKAMVRVRELEGALRELVELKDLKERDVVFDGDAYQDYAKRKPLAWSAARAALQEKPDAKEKPDVLIHQDDASNPTKQTVVFDRLGIMKEKKK